MLVRLKDIFVDTFIDILNIWAALIVVSPLFWTNPSYCGTDAPEKSVESEFAWTSAGQIPEPRSNTAVVRHGQSIYILGGHGPSGASADAWEYKPEDKSWKALPPMPTKRLGHAAVVFDDKIFVFGGVSGEGKTPHYLQSVESYDIPAGVWRKETPMPTPRARLAGARLKNKIYLIGGENASSKALDIVESFQPSIQSWNARQPLEMAATRLAAVTFQDRIYALGGGDIDGDSLNTVSIYNAGQDSWSPGVPLSVPRKNLSAVVYDGQIVAAGGWNIEKNKEKNKIAILDTVEFFSPTSRKWFQVGKLSRARDGARAVSFEESIFLIGGFDREILSRVEQGRWFTRPWTADAPD